MATWDIDVPSAAAVLQSASTQAQEYQTLFGQLEGALTGTLGALPTSPLVAQRLAEFAQESAHPHLEKVAGHTGSALQGTNDAINHYVLGDQEMAALAQTNAALASYPSDVPGVAGTGAIAAPGSVVAR